MQAETERSTVTVGYPEDWRNMTLEAVAEINSESLGKETPAAFQFRYIDIASVTAGTIDWSSVGTHRFATAPSRARRVVRPGDVLLCTVRPGLQAHAYADWSQQHGYICSTGFAVLRGGRAIWPRFLGHLVFSDVVTSQVRRLEVGSNYPAITETDVRWLRIPQPPLPEQRLIAEILDTADQAIGETEALISKLKHMKTGLMHDLLTRGLDERGHLRDPDAHPERFKDSTLGRIPREWEVFLMEELTTKIVDGVHKTPTYVESGVPFLTVENLTAGTSIRIQTTRYVSDKDHAEFWRRADPQPGDVLVSKDGTLGVARIVPDGLPEFSIFVSVAQLRPDLRRALPQLISMFFQTSEYERQLGTLSAGTGLKHIHLEHFRAFKLATPPLVEQHRIAEILGAHDARIRAEEAYRDKLKLQKKGLMDDLLTGRVRVKTAQEVSA